MELENITDLNKEKIGIIVSEIGREKKTLFMQAVRASSRMYAEIRAMLI